MLVLLLAAVCVALFFVGCGGGASEPQPAQDREDLLPADFPVYPGARTIVSFELGDAAEPAIYGSWETEDSDESVVEFYRDQLKGRYRLVNEIVAFHTAYLRFEDETGELGEGLIVIQRLEVEDGRTTISVTIGLPEAATLEPSARFQETTPPAAVPLPDGYPSEVALPAGARPIAAESAVLDSQTVYAVTALSSSELDRVAEHFKSLLEQVGLDHSVVEGDGLVVITFEGANLAGDIALSPSLRFSKYAEISILIREE